MTRAAEKEYVFTVVLNKDIDNVYQVRLLNTKINTGRKLF